MVHDAAGSSGFTHGCDGAGVAADKGDVVFDPLESSTLVVERGIADSIADKSGTVQPTKGTELVQLVQYTRIFLGRVRHTL